MSEAVANSLTDLFEDDESVLSHQVPSVKNLNVDSSYFSSPSEMPPTRKNTFTEPRNTPNKLQKKLRRPNSKKSKLSQFKSHNDSLEEASSKQSEFRPPEAMVDAQEIQLSVHSRSNTESETPSRQGSEVGPPVFEGLKQIKSEKESRALKFTLVTSAVALGMDLSQLFQPRGSVQTTARAVTMVIAFCSFALSIYMWKQKTTSLLVFGIFSLQARFFVEAFSQAIFAELAPENQTDLVRLKDWTIFIPILAVALLFAQVAESRLGRIVVLGANAFLASLIMISGLSSDIGDDQQQLGEAIRWSISFFVILLAFVVVTVKNERAWEKRFLQLCEDNQKLEQILQAIDEPIFLYERSNMTWHNEAAKRLIANAEESNFHSVRATRAADSVAFSLQEVVKKERGLLTRHPNLPSLEDCCFGQKIGALDGVSFIQARDLEMEGANAVIIDDKTARIVCQQLKENLRASFVIERELKKLKNSLGQQESITLNLKNQVTQQRQAHTGEAEDFDFNSESQISPKDISSYLHFLSNALQEGRQALEGLSIVQDLRSGDFQQSNSMFDLQKTLNEIKHDLRWEAKQQRIKLDSRFVGFGFQDKALGYFDQRCFSFVLRSLISNGVKHAESLGSQIQVVAFRIESGEDDMFHFSDFDARAAVFFKDRVLPRLTNKQMGQSAGISAMFDPHPEKAKLVLAVMDNGAGMSRDSQQTLHNQLQGSCRSSGCQGLQICQKICAQFDGELCFLSEKGLGSIFLSSMLLPENKMRDVFPIEEPPLRSSRQGSVVVLDSDPMNALGLIMNLKTLGFTNGQIEVALSWKEAIEVIIANLVDPIALTGTSEPLKRRRETLDSKVRETGRKYLHYVSKRNFFSTDDIGLKSDQVYTSQFTHMFIGPGQLQAAKVLKHLTRLIQCSKMPLLVKVGDNEGGKLESQFDLHCESPYDLQQLKRLFR